MASVSDTRDEVYLAAGSILEQLFEDRRDSELATKSRGADVSQLIEMSARFAADLVTKCREAAAKIDAKPEASTADTVKPVELRTGGIFDEYPLPWRGCTEDDGDDDDIFAANGAQVLTLARGYNPAYCQQIADIINGPASTPEAVKDDWEGRAYAKMAGRSERWQVSVEIDRPANRHGARIDTAATRDGHFVAYSSTAHGAARAVLAAFLVADLDDTKRGLSGLRELNGAQQKAARDLLKGYQ